MKTKITKSKIKKVPESSERDKMMVLLENMRDDIKLVAEGHSILERGIGQLNEKIDSMEDRLDLRIGSLENRLDRRIDSLEKQMKEGFKLVLDHLSGIDMELVEVKAEIKELRLSLENKEDIGRLDLLEERVRKIEMNQLILREKNEKKYKTK